VGQKKLKKGFFKKGKYRCIIFSSY